MLISCGHDKQPAQKPETTKIIKNQPNSVSIPQNSSYWVAIKNELNLSNGQIERLKKIRAHYSKKLKEGKISKKVLLKTRRKKEAEVLRSNKKQRKFIEFNKNWNKK